MEISVRGYRVPVSIDVVGEDGAVSRTLSYEADYSDAKLDAAVRMMRETGEAAPGLDDLDRAAEAMRPAIDLLLGEGATDEIAQELGQASPAGCVTALARVYAALGAEAVSRAREVSAANVARYLDEES